MRENRPLISIVIPVRNEGARIRKAILSFANGRSNLFSVEFVIVDDASDDGCCNGLSNLLSWERDAAIITIIKLKHWSGIPFARNTGAASAISPILFITDANVKACPNWDISIFRDLLPGRALCATIADMASNWRGYGCILELRSMGINWLKDPGIFSGYVPVTPCTGTVIHKELFLNIGGYDTAMPVYGAAEPEFSVRLWLYGAEIVICPDLVLNHRFRPSEERRPFLEQIERIQTKNYIRFGLLYLNNYGINSMLDYRKEFNPSELPSILNELNRDEIVARRNYLQNKLKYNFEWFTNQFQLLPSIN